MEGFLNKRKGIFIIAGVIIIIILAGLVISKNMTGNAIKDTDNTETKVRLQTNYGDIVIELNAEAAPITVKNFLIYVNEKAYDRTIFHRVMDGFMIQGGGFTPDGNEKETHEPIKLESNNGLKNDRGTIAMARTLALDSATDQFFINLQNNDFLNYGVRDEGYAVFGKIIEGMDVVDTIAKVQTTTKNNMQNWPVKDVLIEKVSVL